jgi:hypothetical protein
MEASVAGRSVPFQAQKKGAGGAPFGVVLVRGAGQAISITASISTSAPLGRAATPMAARAG